MCTGLKVVVCKSQGVVWKTYRCSSTPSYFDHQWLHYLVARISAMLLQLEIYCTVCVHHHYTFAFVDILMSEFRMTYCWVSIFNVEEQTDRFMMKLSCVPYPMTFPGVD